MFFSLSNQVSALSLCKGELHCAVNAAFQLDVFQQNTNVTLLSPSTEPLLVLLGRWYFTSFDKKPFAIAACQCWRFSPHHICSCWSCENQLLWHADSRDFHATHPKTGPHFPFWKDFSFSQVSRTILTTENGALMLYQSHFTCIWAARVEPSERLTKTSEQPGLLCVDWCFYVVCVRAQCSLGSIVAPQSARAPCLRAGDAPNQQLLSGVTDSAQPALLRPVCQLLQRAAQGWAGCSAGTFHVRVPHCYSCRALSLAGGENISELKIVRFSCLYWVIRDAGMKWNSTAQRQ